jgi:hypothetical protein
LEKRRRLSILKVEEKAARRGCWANSWALGPVAVMTMVEAFLPARLSSGINHLGCVASASPVLKVVSSLPMVDKEWEVEMPCTRSCAVGESRWTVVVPGIRWRNWEILLLSEVAFTESMVVNMRSWEALASTRWMRVALRAVLMLSLMVTGVVVRGVPSLLMIRRRSLSVGPFLGEGAFAVGGVVAAAGAGLPVAVVFFFFCFLATWAQVETAGVGGAGGEGEGSGGAGPEVDSGALAGSGGGAAA